MNGIRVVVEWEDYGNTLAVWELQVSDRPAGAVHVRQGDVWVEWPQGQGVRPEPTHRFHRPFLDALLGALEESGHEYAGEPTLRHLKDTIEVRDRLLTMLEKDA